MPWDAKSFRSKHNKGLSPAKAAKAAKQANAVLRAGVPEGEAIAIANKHAQAKPKFAMAELGRRGAK
jgi:uncharacterized protein YdaT